MKNPSASEFKTELKVLNFVTDKLLKRQFNDFLSLFQEKYKS